MSDPRLILIAAMSESNRVIGSQNRLPWSVPGDYQQFLDLVRGQAIFMGRTTYEIFGDDLRESAVFVVSRRTEVKGPGVIAGSVAEAIERARATGKTVFCCGGASIYEQTLPHATHMFLSLIHGDHEGDAYFPEWPKAEWREVSRAEKEGFTFVQLERV
ncbi:MAG: dihydrofolate reductase [Myxococcota bacterium]